MIPMELYEDWETYQEKVELLFLADHGGGWPDCLLKPAGLGPKDRLQILRRMGFQVEEEYDMPSVEDWNVWEPWARLTNGVVVSLSDGYVVRSTEAKGG